jgi:SecD/SecF fusion protein
MKNKNTIVFLLIVFSAICIYNLVWTGIQFNQDGKLNEARSAWQMVQAKIANNQALTADDSAKVKAYEALVNDADFQKTYKSAVSNSFTLGLDLQGGMFVTLEVGVDDIVRQMAGNPRDTLFTGAIECANEKRENESTNFVDLFVSCIKAKDPNVNLGSIFANQELGIGVSSSESEVVNILKTEVESTIDRTFNVIRTRIDQFGVVSPNLQKQAGTGRILMELPGVKEPERVRKLLRSTAKLEFHTTFTWREGFQTLQEVNERLRRIRGLVADTTATATDTTATDTTQAVAANDTTKKDTSAQTISDVLNAGDSATDPSSLTDAQREQEREKFIRENPLLGLLQFADYNGLAQQGSNTPLVAYATALDTGKVNKILAMDEMREVIPADMKFVWSFKPVSAESDIFELIALKTNPDGTPALGGEAISNARANFDEANQPVVSMSMNAEGSKEWAKITEKNINKHVAIVLDGMVYSYPVVRQAITGGQSEISGSFTIDDTKDLANVLKAGQLEVAARIVGEETVGPTLGSQNIRTGMISFIVAILITMVFMVFYYQRAGWIATAALAVNILFILGCAAAFTVVFTLPGIAALVLTVGMAVDANVLIFERIREELGHGKTLKASIKAGFSNAFSSVMDSNITTFLTGVILYVFGIGPIRGFAVMLMIGIVTSLISALIISRLILEFYANKGSGISFGNQITNSLFANLKVNMVGKRKTYYGVSGALVVLSIISILTIGMKTGVDFAGGRQFVVEFSKTDGTSAPLSSKQVEQVRGDLSEAFERNAPVIKTLTFDNQLMVTTSYLVDDRDATGKVEDALLKGLEKSFGKAAGYSTKIVSTSDVGPTVASDIRTSAFYAVIFALIMIFLYILLRFRKWQYSLGAVASLAHDVIITMGVFSFLSLFKNLPINVEIDQAFIAAILTIIGYSINDTVVVFDRIRENIAEMKSSKLSDIYNASIDQTLSRTTITSFTTFLTALILTLFGGDVIRGFTFAIVIGVLVGTYSSIFVASPIALDFLIRQNPELDSDQVQPVKAKA